jgi:hypothetical protein
MVSSSLTNMSSDLYVGKRLSYAGDLCTVRYVGEVTGTRGEWLGVEWDDPSRGKHSGEAGGTKYFECLSIVLPLSWYVVRLISPKLYRSPKRINRRFFRET